MLRIGFLAVALLLGGCEENAAVNRNVPGPGYGYAHAYPGYFHPFGPIPGFGPVPIIRQR
jgi:hypothetical protein